MPSPCYLRLPAVAGDRLAFVADDDLWLSSVEGGTARRLTSEHAPISTVAMSPDGSTVAFAGRRDGEPDVFVADVAGGAVRRLTWWGDPLTRVFGWDGPDHVLASTAAAQPFRSRTWAYRVPVDGGPPERLPYGPATSVRRHAGGAVVLGVNQSRSRGAAWKRYRGGTAGRLWLDPDGGGEFAPFLANLDGQLEDPCWVGDRVVFVSDHEGWGNVYSSDTAGGDLRRHTDHEGFYARAAASDGERVVYQCAGDLWRLDDVGAASQPRRLEIELGAPRSGRAPHVLETAEHLGEYSPGRDARGSAIEVRGSVFWLTHREGPARLLATPGGGGATPDAGDAPAAGARARLPRTFGRAGAELVAWVTDAEGDDAIEVAPIAGREPEDAPRRLGAGAIGRVLELAGAPDGERLALATHDGRVIVVELASGELRTLEHSEFGDASGLTFSPDSRWLAWSRAAAYGEEPLRQIRLGRLEDGECFDATQTRFVDRDPVFSLDGKYLIFLSIRTFDPVYDAHVFDMSFPAATRPYLITLAADTPSPFDAEPDGRPRMDEEDGPGKHGTGEAGAGEPSPAAVDLEGLPERVVAVPVPAGRYSHLRAVEGGVVFLQEPTVGVLGEGGRRKQDKERSRLVRFDIARSRQSDLVDELDSFEVSGDGRSLVVRDEKRLRVLPAGRRVDSDGDRRRDEPPPADVVEDVDLARARVRIDPAIEWLQMFDETVRLMRDHYWVEDMADVDWAAVAARYRPLVDRIATRDDLSELIWELHGELATSHCYEMPPPRPVEQPRRLGFLGADLERNEAGEWSVNRILPPETSLPSARSPLSEPGVAMRPGDVVLAVDGVPVDPDHGPGASLVGAAEKPVELLVRSAAGARRVAVVPLTDERPLRYQEWVAGRRAAVHAASGGRVGYLHVPDMMGNGWANLHRDLRLEMSREALLVDVRDNGGGHVSQLVLEKLVRRVLGWDTQRHMQPLSYPIDAPRGPMVALTNEQAGSDGDIITAAFKLSKLGPVVGMRTWGGVIGIDGRYHLVDGTIVTQPRYSFWFEELGWGVENYGVDPDVVLDIAPQDWAAGRDPQLETGVRMLLEALETNPAKRPPDPATRPSRAAPNLPARPQG